MAIKVCVAGATGWAGSELARAIPQTADIELVAAVSRSHAGRRLGEVLDDPRLATLSGLVVSRVLDVPDPKAAVLRASHAGAIAIRATISEP